MDQKVVPPVGKNPAELANSGAKPLPVPPSQVQSTSDQSMPTPYKIIMERADIENKRFTVDYESSVRQALSPFVLLSDDDILCDFESALQIAYDGNLDKKLLYVNLEFGKSLFEDKQGITMTESEFLSLYFYTLEWSNPSLNTYQKLNSDLVNSDRQSARKWKFYLHYLFGALRKIPKWSLPQDLYRGVPLNLLKEYPDKYAMGKKIIWYSCTSTTTNLSQIMKFLPQSKGRTVFTINGAFSGRSIATFSAIPTESEVLLPPGTRFEVVGIAKLDESTTLIQLKQIPSLEQDLQLE